MVLDKGMISGAKLELRTPGSNGPQGKLFTFVFLSLPEW